MSEQAPSEASAAASEPTGSTATTEPGAEPSAAAAAADPQTPNSDSTAATVDAVSATAAAGTPAESPAGASGASSAPESASSKNSGRSHKSSNKSKVEAESPKPKSGTGAAADSQHRAASPAKQHRRKRTKLGELELSEAKIGFIGAGKMAESTINGLIHYAKIAPSKIHVAAPSAKNLERFKTLGCRVTRRNYDIFGRYDCDIIFLCFHGYVIKHCYKLGGSRPHPLTTNYIPHQRHPIYILSLVSGVSLSQIKACLLNPESHSRYTLEIHRIMMNTAVGHGLGICAIDCEPDSKKLSAPLRQMLSAIAQLENVPASQMDAACAIGGSGLAFSYYFINALADGAFKMGLSRQQAIKFASKTAQCAAQTMIESGKHPAELRDNVSSPSGAAIYGIHVLEKNDVASGVTAAVEAAHKRANDLATQDVTQ